MSVQDLQEGHVRAWRTAYSRRNIVRRLARSRTRIPMSLLTNAGYRYYAHHLDTHYTCDWPIEFQEAAQ